MIIKNVKVYTEERIFEEGSIYIEGGRFVSPSAYYERRAAGEESREQEEEVIDGKGCYAVPGLIDLHFHGCMGADLCDGTKEALRTIAEYEASVGVTAIAPATMTLPVKELEKILSTAAEYARRQTEGLAGIQEKDGTSQISKPCADLVGINMEGPFISRAKKGAQDAANIIPCDVAVCERFLEASEGLVKFIGIAPEESEGAEDFIRAVKDKVHVSLAHTNADYDTADAAFRAGADHAVHLYNAMSSFTHRTPGVIGAAADNEHVWAELICDGVHVHPAAVRAAFKMLGAERIVLISDSMRAAGMPDGTYTLGGLEVNVRGNKATLASDGALAGSVTNLMDCMRTVVKEMQIPLETAVACATINPARRLGIEDDYGSISEGKIGDVALLDKNLDLKLVVKRGEVFFGGQDILQERGWDDIINTCRP